MAAAKGIAQAAAQAVLEVMVVLVAAVEVAKMGVVDPGKIRR